MPSSETPPEPGVPGRAVLAYADAGRVRQVVRRLVTTRAVATLSARLLPPLDRATLRLTRRRTTFSGWVSGLPVVLLTTTGARSGLPRTTPVLGIPGEHDVLVVAANFGSERHPAWYGNLRADARATLTQGTDQRDVVAEELHGAEREVAFGLALRLNPAWAQYRHRAGDRVIPVLRLRPVP